MRKNHFSKEQNDCDFSIKSTDSISLSDNDMIIDQNNINNTDKHIEKENEEILQCSVNFNLRDSIIRMIIRFHSKGTTTGSIINKILEYAEITNSLCESLQSKIRQFVESKQILDDSDVSDLLNSFEISKSFEELKTVKQQMEALKSSTEYIEPQEIPLGTRINNIIDKKTGTFIPKKKIVETCQCSYN